MRYRRDYQETHDIDWFFRYKDKVYHAASNGGLLPGKVDSLKNRMLQEKLEDIVGEYEVSMADRVKIRQDEDFSSFREFAAKGFISLDRDDDYENKLHYQRVAFPTNGEVFSNEDLLKLMPMLNENDIEIEL